MNLLGPFPAISFLTFFVAPAHQRIVWEDGLYLVGETAFGLFLGKLGPWLMSHEGFREFYKNASAAVAEAEGNISTMTTTTVFEEAPATMTLATLLRESPSINDTIADL